MNNFCIACGMPLVNKEDVGTETDKGALCKHCTRPDGSAKSCEEIFEGGVQFFLQSFPDLDRAFAERITRKNMRKQPYWQGDESACLKGEEAMDEEFQMVLKRLG